MSVICRLRNKTVETHKMITINVLPKLLICLILFEPNCIRCKSVTCNEIGQFNWNISCTINNYNMSSAMNKSEFEFETKDLLQLKFNNSQMPFIPQGIFNKLPKLQIVDLSKCQISLIERYNFSALFNLIYLNLSYNKLSKLSDSVFEGAAGLNRIDLSNNYIYYIHQDAFKYLNKLLELNLSQNQIKILPNPIFAHTTSINKIDLSGNVIESIECDIFKILKLIELKLNNNNMRTFNETVLQNVKFIKTLKLDSNRFENISFTNLRNIDRLSLNYNNLRVLEISNYVQVIHAEHNKLNEIKSQNISYLHELYLRNNSLSNLKFLKNLTNLVSLDLSYNQIDNFINQSDVFVKLSKLKILKLRSINLNRSDFRVVYNLPDLELIDISYNNLNFINFNWFSRSENLQKLYINGNNLRNHTLDELEYLFPRLNSINISDNLWSCNDLIHVLKRLKQLNITILMDANRSITKELNIRGIKCSKPEEMQQSTSPTHKPSNYNLEFEFILNRLDNLTGSVVAINDRIQKIEDTFLIIHNNSSQNYTTNTIPVAFCIINSIFMLILIVVAILAFRNFQKTLNRNSKEEKNLLGSKL